MSSFPCENYYISSTFTNNKGKNSLMTDQIRDRIRGLLVKAGDDRKKTLGNIRGMVSVLQEDIADHRETIMISLIECGKYLSTKSGIYGTSLALMNANYRVFVSETINGVYSELRYTVADGKMEVSACLLRLLIECANSGCLSASSIISVLRSVVQYSSAAGFKRAEFGLYLVASSLPWLSPSIAMNDAGVKALIAELVAAVSNLTSLAEYQARKALLSPYLGLKDRLEQALESIEELGKCDWETQVLIRPYLMEGIWELVSVEEPLFVHSVPTDDVSLFESIANQKYIPLVLMEETGERLESASERFILTEVMSSSIDLLSQSVGECAKALLRIPFVDVAFEPVLVSVIVSRAIITPSSGGAPRAFYQSLLHRVMVLQESVKIHLDATLKALTSQPEQHLLNEETEFAIADLMCLLFTNNVKLDMEVFPKRILSKFFQLCLRVSFFNTVQAKLPETLHALLVAEAGDLELVSRGTPVERSETDLAEYQKVKEVVRIKDGSEIEVTEVLLKNAGVENKSSSAYQYLVEAMVENGSRTLTHFARLVELYGNIVKKSVALGLVGSEEEREAVILWVLFSFWSHNSLRLEKCVELVMRENLVSAGAIINRVEFDDSKLISYKVAEMVINHLSRSINGLKIQLAESEGTERYDEIQARLTAEEQMLISGVNEMLAKSSGNEGFQQWVVKKFHALISGSTGSSCNLDILQLF